MKKIEYIYKHCPIPGGGYVTGYTFHPKKENILYARTDIGGIYKFDFQKKVWLSLSDHVKAINSAEVLPLALAVDENNPNMLFAACGNTRENVLAVSDNFGKSFQLYPIPAKVNGNSPGRSTGERLAITDNYIYFGSQSEGLLRADRQTYTWEKINVKLSNEKTEKNITFIHVKGDRIIVGTDGSTNIQGNVRKNTLFISNDGGKSFKSLSVPKWYGDKRIPFYGFVPMRCAFDDEYMYVCFNLSLNRNKRLDFYAVDTDPCFDGRIFRYKLSESICEADDITPKSGFYDKNPNRSFGNGIHAIDVKDNVLFITSLSGAFADTIYASFDKGNSYKILLQGNDIGKVEVDVPYMKPEYNGNSTVIHWITDLKINPFNKNHAVLTTGTGAFMTYNLFDCEHDKEVIWYSQTWGIEETVHLNVYSPPSGEVKVIDIVGDLGGFAFKELDKPCENSFADSEGNRYITCLNADFAENDPNIVVATPRGNWCGLTKGGIILSNDQCETWNLLPKPHYLSEELSNTFNEIEKPNIDSGWTAISCDGKTIIWAVAKKMKFPANQVIRTEDNGKTWSFSTFNTIDETKLSLLHVKIYSDRVNPTLFYAFTGENRFFISRDSGKTFDEIIVPDSLINNDEIFFRGTSQVTVEPQNEGILWFSAGKNGLWRINSYDSNIKFQRILNDTIFCVGIGKGKQNSPHKTIFITGIVNDEYGFYRSDDYGQSWIRINNDNQMFGRISAIAGDPREFGRFYIASGSRGLIYGYPDFRQGNKL